MNDQSIVYLIPCTLNETEASLKSLSPEILSAVQSCSHFFVENERTTRRFFKKIWPQMVIDDYSWTTIHKAEHNVMHLFCEAIKQNKTIGIVSEAGCPGIADPGQILVHKAQSLNGVIIKPLTGPSSLLLALMASGLNGQQFCFHGYLPVDSTERKKKIKLLEQKSIAEGSTHLFIETPYRNDALLKDILDTLHPDTLLCIAKDIQGNKETIRTKPIKNWKANIPSLHKIPVVFIIGKNE